MASQPSRNSGKAAPTLPPRQPGATHQSTFDEQLHLNHPTTEDALGQDTLWPSQDPRSSSMQSLQPSESNAANGRRKLLLIYIHGFMGNETSFRSFPAHVHNLLTVLLAETHVVHSKLYPRYRSKRNISFARDDFSTWLVPHESPETDVVLLGHSMGGLLSAEVVLMPPAPPASRALKHSILGTINFDVPFLGMHPGVVKSGLASIFSPGGEPQDQQSQSDIPGGQPPARADTLWGSPDRRDPNFNPSFNNDVVLPIRDGWRNAWHFVSKHSDDLFQASKKLVTSHLEFGGAMANYAELKTRYTRVRALEVDDERTRISVLKSDASAPRVRFVNYYTACTGRPKPPKVSADEESKASEQSRGDSTVLVESTAREAAEEQENVGYAVMDPIPDGRSIEDAELGAAAESLTIGGKEQSQSAPEGSSTAPSDSSMQPENKPQSKELTHHQREELRLEKERLRMEAEGRRLRGEKSPAPTFASALADSSSPAGLSKSNTVAENSSDQPSAASLTSSNSDRSPMPDKHPEQSKPRKDRTFCTLPPKDSNGQRDPCWVRVFMKDVDEVGAHCGLFFIDERYERLVGEIAERVEGWVKEDQSLRALSFDLD